MSKYQALIDARDNANANGWTKLIVPSEDIRAILADLERAEKALAALAQQAQEPVSPDMHRWCAYVGGMVAHWVKSEPDARERLGDDAFEAAIAGIIERRLWAIPKRDTTPQPQPAPLAGEVTDGELNPRRAYEFGQLITKYSDAFNDQDWGGINESVDRKNLAVALDHLTQAGAMLMNVSDRLEQTNRAILALRPAVEPMTDEVRRSYQCLLAMNTPHGFGDRIGPFVKWLQDSGITAKAEGGV